MALQRELVQVKREGRRKEIMDLLIENRSVDLEDLAVRFSVSKMTIHRDLDDLEGEGVLRKVRGGASIDSGYQFESDYRYREQLGAHEKTLIAKAALALIEPGMSVLINDGSTASLLGEMLPEKRPLTVISNNMSVITALSSEPGITMIALGGTFSQKFNGFFGIVTEESLSRLHADIAFISSPAVDGKQAYHMDGEVVRTKRLMISAAAHAYLMVDSQKFGRPAMHQLAPMSDFKAVITDASPDDKTTRELAKSGTRLIIANQDRQANQGCAK